MTTHNTTTFSKTLIATLTILLFIGFSAAAAGTVTPDTDYIQIGDSASFTIGDSDDPSSEVVGFTSSTESEVTGVTETFTGDSSTATFNVGNTPIADTNNDGTIAGDEVTATADGSSATVSSVNPQTGDVTLNSQPADGATVEITYDHYPEANTGVDISSGSTTTSISTASSDSSETLHVSDTDTVTAHYWDSSEGVYQTGQMTVDDSNPTATFNSVDYSSDSSATSGETVTINYDATDTTSIESATARILDGDSGTLVEDTSATTGSGSSTTLTIPSSTADGDYTVEVVATDSAGNQDTDSTGTVTVDDYVESGTLSVDNDPVQSSESIQISGTVTGTADDITFQLDDGTNTEKVTKSISNTGFSTEIDLSSLSTVAPEEGSVTLNAEQESSYSSADDTTTFTVDNTNPSINSISEGDYVTTSTPTFTITLDGVNDGSNGLSAIDTANTDVTLTDGEGNSQTLSAFGADSPLSVQNNNEIQVDVSNADASSLAEGTLNVQVSAQDNAGNSNTDSQDAFTVDTVAPSISGFSVDNPSGQLAEVSFDSDELISTIDVSGDGNAPLAQSEFTESGDAESGFTYTATLSDNSDGTFSATLDTAEDAAGNNGASSQSDSTTVDTTAPTLDSSDDGTTKTSSTPSFTFTVSDATTSVDESTLDLKIADSNAEDGAEFDQDNYGTGSGVQYDGGTFTVDVSNLENSPSVEDGSVTVTFAVDDTEGNSLAGETFGFTVDTEAPSIASAETTSTNTVEVTLSDDTSNVDTGTIEAGDFQVNGNSVTISSSFPGSNSDSVTGTLKLSEGSFSTGATPDVSIVSGSSGISDVPGNTVNSQTFEGTTDGVAPVVSEFEVEEGSRKASVMFSEDVNAGEESPISAGDLSYTDNSGSSQGISSVSHIAGTDQVTVVLKEQVSEAMESDSVDVNTGESLQDLAGNSGDSSSVTATDNRDQISLTEGWNLLSTPQLQAESTSELLSGVEYSGSPLTYDDGQWVESASEMSLDEMDAVYINSDKPQEIELDRDTGVQNTPQDEVLETGWNLVGPSLNVEGESELNANIDVAFNGGDIGDDDSKGITNVVSPIGNWDQKKAEGFGSQKVEAFRGYWVFSKSQEVIS